VVQGSGFTTQAIKEIYEVIPKIFMVILSELSPEEGGEYLPAPGFVCDYLQEYPAIRQS